MASSGDTRTFALASLLFLAVLLVACSGNFFDETFVPSLTVPATTTTTTTTTPGVSTQPGSSQWSSTIVASPNGSLLYVANPDSGSVTAIDVVYALKRQGRTLYGFGG